MGRYINQDSKGNPIGPTFDNKLKNLLADGALRTERPTEWREGLVCVVNNGMFAAAAYCYDKEEMQAFLEGMNGRQNQWLEFSKAKDLAD